MSGKKIIDALEEAVIDSSGCVFHDLGIVKPDIYTTRSGRTVCARKKDNVFEINFVT